MHDDYLWDGTGPVDDEVVALQRTLAPLRFEPEPLRIQSTTPHSHSRSAKFRWAPPILAAAAAASLVLGLRSASDEAPMGSGSAVRAVEPQTHPSEPGAASQEVQVARVSAVTPAADEESEQTSAPAVVRPSEAAGESASDRVRSPATARGRLRRATPQARSSQPDVDCILDGEACAREDADLPRLISSADIRAGIAPLKLKASACGTKHGLDHEAKVKVKMTVVGSTGRVSAASPQGEWAGTPVGDCVAETISKARFPKFKKDSLGVVYPITVRPISAASTEAKPLRSRVRGQVTIKARACAVAHDIMPDTRVQLSLEVAASGAIDSVLVRPVGLLSKDARHCLKTSIRKMKLGEQEAAFTLHFPVTL